MISVLTIQELQSYLGDYLGYGQLEIRHGLRLAIQGKGTYLHGTMLLSGEVTFV